MKLHHRLTRLAFAAAFVAVTGAANADIVGTQTATASDPKITVGSSVVWVPTIHSPGKAGVGVSDYSLGMKVDFQGIADFSSTTSTDLGSKVVRYDYAGKDHGGLGTFTFAKVGSGDVWFGEWSDDGSPNYTNRQAFYVGDNKGTTLPTSTATYATKGINHGNVIAGNLTATFGGSNTLTGTLSGSNLSIALSANINTKDASFSGKASANNSIAGTTAGHFFGAGATALAGVADFGTDNTYNTAFGGTKN